MTPYLRAANIKWTGLDLSDVKEMDFTTEEAVVFELRNGDVLVGEASGSKSEVGKSAIWRDEVPGACFQNTLIRVRPYRSITSEYLQAHLNYDARSGALATLSKGVGIHHLSAKGLSGWKLALPPLNEQRRIVDKIEALTARSRRAKEALDAVPALLDKLRQSILAAAFRGDLTKEWRAAHPDVEPASVLLDRIRKERRARWEEAELAKMRAKGSLPKDDKWKSKYVEPEPVNTDDLPELPEGWAWASLDDVATLETGGTPPGKVDSCYGGTIPFVKPTDLDGGIVSSARQTLTESGAAFVPVLPARSVLVTCIGATIGKTALSTVACAFNQQINGAVPLTSLLPEHLYWWIVSSWAQIWIRMNSSSTTLPILNKGRFARLPVPLAGLAEQQALVAALRASLSGHSALYELMLSLSKDIQSLDSAILAKAFRGELVPQDPKDEPASALLERIRAERESGVTTTPTKKTRTKRTAKASKSASR